MLARFYNLLMKQNVSACVCVCLSFKNICKIASSRRQGRENRNFPSSVNIVILCIHRRQHFRDSTLKCFWNCKRSKLLLKAFYVSGIVLGSEKITIFKNPWTWPEDLFDWWRASKQYYIDRVKMGHHQAMKRAEKGVTGSVCWGSNGIGGVACRLEGSVRADGAGRTQQEETYLSCATFSTCAQS